MDEKGLLPVANPSALFISQRDIESEGASSAVCVTMNGARPLLVEIQALCTESHQVRSFCIHSVSLAIMGSEWIL